MILEFETERKSSTVMSDINTGDRNKRTHKYSDIKIIYKYSEKISLTVTIIN